MSKKELIKIETYFNVEKDSLEIDTKISLMMKCMAEDSKTLDLLTEKIKEISEIIDEYFEIVNKNL